MTYSLVLNVVGCGDAMSSGGRFNTCFLIDDAIGRFAIDFGASSMAALNANSIDPDSIDAIFLSHLHGDHFGAVPNLLLKREYASESSRRLTIAGPPGLKRRILTLCEAMFPGMWKDTWKFGLDIVEIEPGMPLTVLGRLVKTYPVNHYAGAEPSTAIRIATGSWVIAYSGDTGWDDVLIEVAKGTDVFLCDCFDRVDQPFPGHMSYDTLLSKADQLETKRLLMTHLGPHMVDAKESFEIEEATDGMRIELK